MYDLFLSIHYSYPAYSYHFLPLFLLHFCQPVQKHPHCTTTRPPRKSRTEVGHQPDVFPQTNASQKSDRTGAHLFFPLQSPVPRNMARVRVPRRHRRCCSTAVPRVEACPSSSCRRSLARTQLQTGVCLRPMSP